MADLAFTVYLPDPHNGGQQTAFGPGDKLPAWAAKLIGPHAYEGYDPENMHTDAGKGDGGDGGDGGDPSDAPPQSGRGSGVDAWLAYARLEANASALAAADLEVTDDASRADILDALRKAGVDVGDPAE